jgi:putative ABC transport system ATP-binding protein
MTAVGEVLAELAGVSRRFDGQSPVIAVDHCDLTVLAGDYISISGPSGSGKSTLLTLLGLLDAPSAGNFFINSTATSKLSEAQRTRLRSTLIGFVFQDARLIPYRTVVENIEIGLMYSGVPRRDRPRLALDAATAVGLGHRVDALPPTLSGGERQRAAIARATVKQPALLLADEPTGNLDARNTDFVLDLFDALNARGQTVIIVTHEVDVAARCRRHFTMTDGRLAEAL